MSQRKAHLANGVLIGIGAVMIILGFVGWFSTNYLFSILSSILQDYGIDTSRHYMFSELSGLNICYVLLMAAGIACFVVGLISEKRLWKKGLQTTSINTPKIVSWTRIQKHQPFTL